MELFKASGATKQAREFAENQTKAELTWRLSCCIQNYTTVAATESDTSPLARVKIAFAPVLAEVVFFPSRQLRWLPTSSDYFALNVAVISLRPVCVGTRCKGVMLVPHWQTFLNASH